MKILKREDYGLVDFGDFKGRKWSDLKEEYLRYLISSECWTSARNKEIARKELEQRKFLDGQQEMI